MKRWFGVVRSLGIELETSSRNRKADEDEAIQDSKMIKELDERLRKVGYTGCKLSSSLT